MPFSCNPRHELVIIAETRCKHIHVRSNAAPTAMDGGSAGFAGYVHGWTVVGQCRSNCRAKTCHAAHGHSNNYQSMPLQVNGTAVF